MKRTIQKVLVELKAEKPDLSYIRGLLEGLVEEEPISTSGYPTFSDKLIPPPIINEEEIPAHLKPGPIGNIA